MDLFDEIVRLRRLGQKCALATIVEVNGSIPSYESAKMLVREDGSLMGTVGALWLKPPTSTNPSGTGTATALGKAEKLEDDVNYLFALRSADSASRLIYKTSA